LPTLLANKADQPCLLLSEFEISLGKKAPLFSPALTTLPRAFSFRPILFVSLI